MTAVWTAMSLQRSDIDSNTLSRSLGSLMIPPVDDEYNATVVLHSNMATEPPLSTTESHSRWSTDAETQSSAPFVRQVSAPNPQFQKLITNSASSVTFLGKRITREYQSHFVLPDKQMVAVTRKETFLPEEAHSEVTLSLSLAGPPELADKTRLDNFGRVNKRIFDYLDPGDWASAILASSESRDAELLGRLGSKYSSSVARKTRFERSASRKSREEIVMARELYSEDEEEEDDIVLNEEEELMGHVDNAMHVSVGDDDTQRSVKRAFRQSPVDSDKEFNSSKFTHLSSFDHTSLVHPTPSRVSSHLTQSKSLDITPPIIARSDQPGIKVKPLSDVRSRLNFEELRRKWDERVAREQSHLDEQWEYGQGGETQSGKLKHHEGHRGSAVTSILPTIDRKLRSGDERNRSKSFVVGRDQTLMSDSASKTRFLVNRTNTLPDRTYKQDHAPRSPPGSDQNEQYSQSPHSVLSEPVTDREEKDAKFLYTHEKLRVGQENIGYLSPLSRDGRTPTDVTMKRSTGQFDHYKHERPCVPPRLYGTTSVDKTGSVDTNEVHPVQPPRPQEITGDYKGNGKPDVKLYDKKHLTRGFIVEQVDDILSDQSVKGQPIHISPLSKESTTTFRDADVRRPTDILGRPKKKMPPPPRSDHPKQVEHKPKNELFKIPHKENVRETEFSHNNFVCTPEPERPALPTEMKFKHVDVPATPMGRSVQVDSKVHEKSSQSHRKPINVLADPDKATAHADVKTIDNRILDTRKPSGKDLDHPGHDNEHDDCLGLLAPQPYRNRYSVPSIELGEFVGGGSKPNDIGSASRRKPRPASIASVPVDSTLTGNKAEPKLLRRRSHLDRRLDEQIDKVYSEELIRRASLPPERGLSVDRDSSSGLSALATYEEHQRARQIEDILKPGRSTEKHRLPTQTLAGKHTDKSKSSSTMKLIGGPSKDISLPSQSEDQVSKSIHPKRNGKDRQMNQDHGRPKYSGQEKIGRKRTFEPNELQKSPTADLIRDETKKMPFTQLNSVVQPKSKSSVINVATGDRKRHSTDPTEPAERKFSSRDELNVRKSRFPPSDDNRHRPNSTTKADSPKSSDVINLKSPLLSRSKVKGDLKRTESSREPIQRPSREPSAAQLDNNDQKPQKHLENQDEITAIELGKGDERKSQGNLGKMKKDLPSVERSLSGRGAIESHHGLNKRRTLDASDLKRFLKGDKSSENPDNVEARELNTQKRPRSIDGRRPLKDRNPLTQRVSHPKSSRPEGRLTECEPTKNKSVHQIDPTEHSFPGEKSPIRRAQGISTSSRSNRTGSSDEVTGKSDRSRGFESLELDRPEKQRHQAKKKPIGTPSSRVSPGTEPTRTKQKCSERSPNENVRKKPVTDQTASLYDPYDSSAGKSPQLHGRNQDTTKGASIKRTPQDQGEGTYKQKPEDEALSEKQYGHKRHPPPPTSPPMRYSANAGDERPSETFESHRQRSSAAKQDNTESISGQMSSKNSSQKLSNKEADHMKRSSYPSRASDTHKPLETSKSVDPAKRGSPYPDEYDIHNETGPRKHATTGGRGPRIFGVTSSGEQRKRPESQIQDQRTSGMAKEKKTSRKARHPSPPKPPVQRAESRPKIEDERPRPRHRPRHRHNQTMDEDTEPTYVNVGGSIPNGSEPWEEEWTKKSPEFSERSNEHSSYDPRVNDQGALKARRPAHRPPPPPPPTTTFPSGSTSRSQENREGGRHPKRAPEAAPRSQPTAKLEESREAYHDDDDDDDDDLEDSECDLKPPPLRISQTKKYSESIVPSQRYSGDSTKQHRASSRGSQQMSKPQPSIRGSLLSPGGMSASSLPQYFPGGPLDKVHSGGPYRPEQFHPHHYEQIPHERPSRPRSKRITATSQDLAPPGVSGSKHSLIISTKRRTLSGVTGTNPIKQRSKSMNELWFGDHPVPSSGALSPNAPLRLSNIQLQAQAELERRHRSSSHAHSLDRRSGLSYGYGPESHASGAPADVEGYEGVGYGYDTRGRLIHGGAPLHERAVSRKRRLLDGHESLSRVWIPQSAAASTLRSDDLSLSAATRLSERKAHLDDSAVAFALRDFTSAGARIISRRASDGDQASKLSAQSEHIYARPSSLLQGYEIGSRADSTRRHDRRNHVHSRTMDRNSFLYCTGSLYRPEVTFHKYLRRPRLVPDRWGSVPLPNPPQYDSLIRLSANSLASRSSQKSAKYVLESNV